MSSAVLFDIEHGSVVDGPGIRTTVFFKGCNLRCAWCHNPESQSASPQMLFFADKCRSCGRCKAVCTSPDNCTLCGKCADVCAAGAKRLCGYEMPVEEIVRNVLLDTPFYGHDGGVTVSGGECMLQIDALEELLIKCRQNGVHTAVDTAGNVPWEYFERVLPYTDLFLYDIKAVTPSLHEKYTGVGNARILANFDALVTHGADILVRVPLIPSVNDTETELAAFAALFAKYPSVPVEVLPYHRLGESKAAALGLDVTRFDVPDGAAVGEARKKMLGGKAQSI